MVIILKFLKKFLKAFLIYGLIILLFGLIYTILIYFNKINLEDNEIKYTSLGIGILLFFLLGIISGLMFQEKGFLTGAMLSTIFIIILVFIRIIKDDTFSLFFLIKYVLYIIFSAIGGSIMVNVKKRSSLKR